MNLAQSIAEVARRQPDAPAFIADKARLTYAELDAGIRNVAAAFAQSGVARGAVVGIGLHDMPFVLLTALALSSLGALALPLPLRRPSPERNDLARRYGVTRVVSARAAPVVDNVPVLRVPANWRRGSAAAPADPAPASLPWIVVMSSGTTGTPKAIAFRQDDTIEYAGLMQDVTNGGCGPGTRTLCFALLHTAFALRPCMRHLLHGGAVIFMRNSLHREVLDVLRRERVTHTTMSPPWLGSICRLAGDGGPHLPHMLHLAVGGAAVPPDLMQMAKTRLTPNIYAHYGASEAGLVALADPGMSRDDPGSSGRLMNWLEAEAVDEDGRRLAAGRPGALRFRGKGVAHEYFGDPETSERVFRDGWFYPGDSGQIDAGGMLRVTGRTDERINLGGVKFNPGEIERVIDSHPLVRESAAFTLRGASGELRLCAAVAVRSPLSAAQLREYCSRELRGARLPVGFFGVSRLPRNENGKLLRRDLPALVRATRHAKRA